MAVRRSTRPSTDEYPSFLASYVAMVPDGDVIEALIGSAEITAALLHDVSDEVAGRAYAEGKWTLKEVLLHCADAERIFTYRALRMARGDETPLPGWDENEYAPMSGANERTLDSILDEFESVRDATVTLFQGLPEAAWSRAGMANGRSVTVRAIAWIVAGHLLHHLAVMQEKYLVDSGK